METFTILYKNQVIENLQILETACKTSSYRMGKVAEVLGKLAKPHFEKNLVSEKGRKPHFGVFCNVIDLFSKRTERVFSNFFY